MSTTHTGGEDTAWAAQMIAWMGDPNAPEDRLDEIEKFWGEGTTFREAVAQAMLHNGAPLSHAPKPPPTPAGETPLEDAFIWKGRYEALANAKVGVIETFIAVIEERDALRTPSPPLRVTAGRGGQTVNTSNKPHWCDVLGYLLTATLFGLSVAILYFIAIL